MSGGSHIRAVGPESGADAPVADVSAEPLTLEESWAEDAPGDDAWYTPAPRPARGWMAPALAGVAVAAWTGFYGWVNAPAILAGASPQEWTAMIVAWSVPVLLVVSLLMLAMRLSRREAGRFNDAAAALRSESVALEGRLSVVNRELSLAREFLAAQTRDLESLGRIATQRLSESAERLQDLVRDNGDQVEAIAGVSRAAMDNMDKLRGDLPVIANAARDMSNQIGAVGATAHGQLDELVGGFNRLNEFGQASERQVASLRAKVDAALAAFEAQAAQLDEIAGTRFTALRERSEVFRTELDGREVEALAAMRHRAERLRTEIGTSADELEAQEAELLKSLQARVAAIRESADTIGESLTATEREAVAAWARQVAMFKEDFEVAVGHVETIDTTAKKGAEERLRTIREEAELVDAKLTQSHAMFVTEVEKRRAEAAAIGIEQADGIAAKLAEFDAAIAQRRAEHAEISQRLVGESAALSQRIAALSGEMERAAGQGEHARSLLAAAVDALAERLTSSRDALGDTDRAVAALTDASVRLLELIRASATHSREELPLAIGDAEARLTALGERGEALGLMLGKAAERSHEVSEYVLGAQRESASAIEGIAAFRHRNTQAHEETLGQLAQLRDRLRAVADDSEALSASARGALSEAIETLGSAARDALAGIESDAGERIETLAAGIADRSKVALDQALQQRVGEALAELETGAAQAAGVGREAAVQLRDQLAKVNELAANLESRVETVRRRAEEQVDNDFSRRVALISESLHSHAIDIARALDSDVSDTAWTSYLRGDRGIFTRRAVRLLEPGQARQVAELYDANGEFREHVNRYIHDFEGMLRTMLSTRDGHAIGVTLLSSDMGKLYVALAQAIERLRD